MRKRAFCASLLVLLMLPAALWAADIPAKIYESGADNVPAAVAGVKVDVYGGYGFKALLSSAVSGDNGDCVLGNVPLGKEVMVKLSKAGYVTQYDIRSYAEGNTEDGAILWIGSLKNVTGLYNNLGQPLDVSKGQVYIEINDEMTGEGIEGVNLVVSSGTVFDLGKGEYLLANAAGKSLTVGIQKPGYAFDIESVTVPLFPGAMTQAYVNEQSGGAVYSSQAAAVLTASITGHILRLSDSQPISGVKVSFFRGVTEISSPVFTDANGFYRQDNFPTNRIIKVVPAKTPWKFRPIFRILIPRTGVKGDFKGFQR